MENYQKLINYHKKIYAVSSAISMLHWDSATIMPSSSSKYRNNQITELSKILHNFNTSNELFDLINKCKDKEYMLSDFDRANLREIEKQYNLYNVIDEKLSGEFTKASYDCEFIWRKAKAESDFNLVADSLKHLVDLEKQIMQIKASKFKVSNYEALMLNYDYGRKEEEINSVFGKLKEFLPGFIDQVIEKQKISGFKKLNIKIPKEAQKAICLDIMKDLGFDLSKGRIDESLHPFSGGVFGDIRITTFYDEEDALKSIFGTVHETGHALYEQGLPEQYYDQPLGNSLGMTIHESQSLLYEMQLGSSLEFLEYLSKLINKHAGLKISAQELWQSVNNVEKSFIRIFADEVTYPLHVILRYEIEQEIFNNKLEIKDLPHAWNEKLKKYLGITPSSDKEGCLQDIHWYAGSFGYFPCYSLGAITAAQLFDAGKSNFYTDKSVMNIFSNIKNWLNENVHKKGSVYSPDELMKKIAGSSLNVDVYVKYLREKYL